MNAPRLTLAAIALSAIAAGCTPHTPPPASPSIPPSSPELPPPSSNPTPPNTPNTDPSVPPTSPKPTTQGL
jgi:hypothetical protein